MKFFMEGILFNVVESDVGLLLGYSAHGKTRFQQMDTEIELYSLYVEWNHQRQGTGKYLLDEILRDYNSIGVITFDQNPYKSFYFKHGFVQVGTAVLNIAGENRENIILRKQVKCKSEGS